MNGSKSKSRGRGSLNEVRPRRPEQCGEKFGPYLGRIVSMKSGLEGRNNPSSGRARTLQQLVSMKSGLEGRNNRPRSSTGRHSSRVSMKSGLEGRNNESRQGHPRPLPPSLNEVRPRRPEQFTLSKFQVLIQLMSQ